MKYFPNKRGLSGIITLMLIVGIAVVAVGVVWFTINNLVSEQTEELASSSNCLSVVLEITSVGTCEAGSTSCNVTVERKSGGGDIEGVRAIVTDDSGTLSGDYTGSFGPLEMKTISATGTALAANATTAKVAVLIEDSSGDTYVCNVIDSYEY
jgi:hypothetical protein